MSSLAIRRFIVWVVGMGLGLLIAWLIITVGFALLPSLVIPPIISPVQSRSTSIQEYGIIYFLATGVPLGIIFVTWLDLFLDTRILPD